MNEQGDKARIVTISLDTLVASKLKGCSINTLTNKGLVASSASLKVAVMNCGHTYPDSLRFFDGPNATDGQEQRHSDGETMVSGFRYDHGDPHQVKETITHRHHRKTLYSPRASCGKEETRGAEVSYVYSSRYGIDETLLE